MASISWAINPSAALLFSIQLKETGLNSLSLEVVSPKLIIFFLSLSSQVSLKSPAATASECVIVIRAVSAVVM